MSGKQTILKKRVKRKNVVRDSKWMRGRKEGKKKAFTIIEVVLVLAIAGLIFLMVFVALPALQRSQRNTQRKEDMARIAARIQEFMNRNHGILNDDFAKRNNRHERGFIVSFYDVYMEPAESYTDPSTGNKYVPALWNQSVVNGELREGDICGSLGYEDCVNDEWPEIKVGEFQYDCNGVCTEQGDFTDEGVANTGRYFAIRYALEGGAYGCIDNVGSTGTAN